MKKIAIIGAGQMAEALLAGLLASSSADPAAVFATDSSAERRDVVKRRFGIRVGSDNAEAASWAEVVLLAVKPQVLDTVLAGIGADLAARLVISIAAGVSIRRIAQRLPRGARIVRVMPNVGRVVTVEERLMDAVTGLSGSGPAYVFMAIEAMADGGVKMGLPRTVAEVLAAQTVLGAARMMLETGEHPARLKDRVASPGGTTIAGLHQLEQGRLRACLIAAVEAATKRSEEMGQ